MCEMEREREGGDIECVRWREGGGGETHRMCEMERERGER